MATLKFQLRPPKDNQSNIYFRLSYGAFEIVDGKKRYRPLDYYITETIDPKHWDAKEGRAYKRKTYPQHPEFNTRLDYIENEVNNIVRRLQNDNIELTEATIRAEIDKLLNKEPIKEQAKQMELMEFIDYFITNCNRSEGTKKSYRIVERDLKEFQKKKKGVLTFNKIDIDFHSEIIAFYKGKGKNYAPNTIGTRIKIIKTFMSEAYERSLHTNLDFKKKSFSKPNEETTAIYLNTNELTAIYNLDLSKDKYLDNVRDWFLIGAYTGLRFSDLKNLTKDNIQSSNIEIRTQKTDTIVTIPLSSIVKEIFEKHNYELPQLISSQKFNDYIKEVAKRAKIDELILVEETKGTLSTRRQEKKYNLISAHTARRSFATNAFKANIPPIQIMKMTGHKSESSFLKYIKVDNKENANILQLHPFFNMKVK